MSVRDTIRKAKPRMAEYPLVDGSKLWIRALSGKGRDAYTEYAIKAKENGGIKAHVIAAMAICEQDGTLVYDWKKDEDLEEIRGLDGADLDGIGIKLFELSGLTKEAVEEAAKN